MLKVKGVFLIGGFKSTVLSLLIKKFMDNNKFTFMRLQLAYLKIYL